MENLREIELEINRILEQVQLLYLCYCIPQVVLLNNGDVIFTYRWTSFEMEQVYYDLLSKLLVLNLKLKDVYQEDHKNNLHRTIENKE